MEFDSLRNEIIAKVPSLDPQFWSYYDDALNEMSGVVWTPITPNIRKAQPMAFATRSKNKTGVFEIYVNPNVPYECRQPLELHEFGHVIFTHMSLLDSQREILIRKIMSFWHNFEKHIDDEAIKTKEEIRATAKVICDAMLNIAMDYEVNSKLFTEEEFETFKTYVSWANAQAVACAPKATEDDLNKVLEWINDENPDKEPLFQPCWPADAGFPLGKDYRQYLDLMLMKPDNAMEQIKQMIQDAKSKADGDGDGDGSSGGSNGKLTKEDIDKLREQYNDANASASNEAKEEAEKQDAEEKGYASTSHREQYNGIGWSPVGHTETEEEFLITNNKKLEQKLLKEIFNKEVRNTHQDNMYYYNRQKYNSNLMISKDRPENLYRPGNIYLLVDCSGSIGNKTISTLIGTVKRIAKKCGAHSRLIWWDTKLQGDFKLKKFGNPNGTGGTFISDGIKYVRENYLDKTNDKLVIISDYQDSLHHWYDELVKINEKNDCIGICWRNIGYGNKMTGKEYLEACSRSLDERGSQKEFVEKLTKRLPTTIVNIPRDFE